MKKKEFQSTWIFIIFVVALALYTYCEYKKAPDDLQETKGEYNAFKLERGQIYEIQLVRKNETVVMREDGDDWKLVQPVDDLAENSSVDGFIFSVTSQKLRSFRSEDESKVTNWAEFGLAPEGSKIEFKGKIKAKEVTETILIGTKNAYDGSFYVRRGDTLLLGDRALAQLIDRDVASFRSRRLWRLGEVPVERLLIKTDSGTSLSLSKNGDKWEMEPKVNFAIFNEKVISWIEKIQTITPADIAADVVDEKTRTEFLLKRPTLEVTLQTKKESTADDWKLIVGQNKGGDIFLHTNQKPVIYKMMATQIGPLKVNAEYFRDTRPAFQVPVEQARQVNLRTQSMNYTVKRSDNDWKLVGAEHKKLNPDKLAQMFQSLRALAADELVKGSGKGFKSQPQITILDEHGAKLFSLSWGDAYKPTSGTNKGMDLYYVKTSLDNGIMGVAKSKIDLLVDAKLVENEDTKATTSSPPLEKK